MPGAIYSRYGPDTPNGFSHGQLVVAFTSKGRGVSGWLPDSRSKDLNSAKDYWCHGLSLGTYLQYGYTISGECVRRVLADEYFEIAGKLGGSVGFRAGTALRLRDVVLFEKAGGVAHTCLVLDGFGNLTTSITVMTKNGSNAIKYCRLQNVMNDYPECAVTFWRQIPPMGESPAKPNAGSSVTAGSTFSSSSSSSSSSSYSFSQSSSAKGSKS